MLHIRLNMREIKFRVWIKEDKSMVNGNENMNNKISFLGGIHYIHTDRADGLMDQVFIGKGGNYRTPDEAILMQYTGLKDKNGVEIYEGDILCYEATGNIAECYWNENGFWHDWEDLGLLKVIGNIYETPELLNKD
jgi:uncharacterized phage protein (TIGR01671 family)